MLGITKTLHHAVSPFTRGDMSLQHIPGKCSRNIFMCVQMLWFCPWHMSPQCVLHTFLSLQHVAATRPLVSGHLNAHPSHTWSTLPSLRDTPFWDVTVSLHSWNNFLIWTLLVSDIWNLSHGANHWNLVFVAAVCSTWLLSGCFLGFYEFPFVVDRLWIPVACNQPGVLWHPDSERFLLPLPASMLSVFQCTCIGLFGE